jgi:hypothetical protein
VNKQFLATVVRRDKPKTFFLIKPFYCSCTHYCTPSAFLQAVNNIPVPHFSRKNIPERQKEYNQLRGIIPENRIRCKTNFFKNFANPAGCI